MSQALEEEQEIASELRCGAASGGNGTCKGPGTAPRGSAEHLKNSREAG